MSLTPKGKVWLVLLGISLLFWTSIVYGIYKWTSGQSPDTLVESSSQEMDQRSIIESLPEEIIVTPQVSGEELDANELECLALNIYFESRGDSLAGRAAVADVVLNRVADTYYPNTICDVVKQGVIYKNWKGNMVPKKHMCQFSWYCDGLSEDIYDNNSWQDAIDLAENVLKEEQWRGITEGATHYHAAHVRPNWIADRGMQYTGTIGQHEFYRWNR